MKTATHGNGNGLNDLHILPESADEWDKIADYLKSIGQRAELSKADVQGHEWFGRWFFDIPFGESLEPEIRAVLQA